jgi:uncharacterized coiled-coil DUF342 family protein
MSLSKKIMVISICMFALFSILMQTVSYSVMVSSFSDIVGIMKSSMESMSADSIKRARESLTGRINDMKMLIGIALQPGEEVKFLALAKQEAAQEGVGEFSFFGIDRKVTMSSDPKAVGKAIAAGIWDEGEKTRQNVVREDSHNIEVYAPYFADADMGRFHPGWKPGQYFGMLYVRFSKEHINKIVEEENEKIEKASAVYDSAKRKMMLSSGGIILISLIVSSFVLAALFMIYFHRSIKGVIENLSSGSGQVMDSSGEVSEASHEIAEGANQQAASLEQISASVSEISAITSRNAETAGTAARQAGDALSAAESGGSAMKKLSDAIEKIKSSANETAKIVKTIDEIAFQTNLLALNAAVEAARAGEAGKGFAVVAEEVRNLAQRSAEAAKTTASLIEESKNNAETGVSATNEARSTFAEISGKVTQAEKLIRELAAACGNQVNEISGINRAIEEVDKVTQTGAASAEKTAAIGAELAQQASALNSLVDKLVFIIEGAHIAGVRADSSQDMEPGSATVEPRTPKAAGKIGASPKNRKGLGA